MAARYRPNYRNCGETRKRGYSTRRDAKVILRRMHNAAVLHIYECPTCGLLHIGHIAGWKRSRSAILSPSTADA